MNIIKIEEGNFIKEHTDKVEDGKHLRLLIKLWDCKEGGILKVENTLINILDRIILFRPDLQKHSLTKVIKGKIYYMSLGKVL